MEPLLVVALVLLAIVTVLYITLARSRTILEDWARDNHYELLSARFCWLWRGPFFLRSVQGQSVYHIRVSDANGRRRSGWVRCGGFFLGLFSDRADVYWDD